MIGSHSGYKFSTKDQDNDISGDSCAVTFKGGWWYSKCHTANLNGLYLKGDHTSYADGINWLPWRGYHHSLKFTEMKMKPADARNCVDLLRQGNSKSGVYKVVASEDQNGPSFVDVYCDMDTDGGGWMVSFCPSRCV